MKTIYLRFVSCVGALALFSVAAPCALAQCALPAKAVKPASWSPQLGARHAQLRLVDDDNKDRPSIVGMWHVVFTGQSYNGGPYPDMYQPVDNALVIWHSDGTEIMNSARPAQDGNFCLGVWKHNGEGRYYLNHFPWKFNDTTGAPAGIGVPQDGVQLTEEVVLSPDGKSYSGTFTLKQYDSTGTLTTTIKGILAATRITTETPFTDLL